MKNHCTYLDKYEKEVLSENYENFRIRLKKHSKKIEDLSVSNRCYFIFGINGASLCKCIGKKWHHKTVNYWKDMNYNEFVQKLAEVEWEEM